MSEESKEIARRFIDEFNKGNMAVFDELLAADFVDLTPLPGSDSTREGWKQASQMEFTAFPDLRMELQEQIAEGDLVVNLLAGSGTHQDDFMGIPATGKEVTAANITIFRVSGGKITERRTVFDALGLMAQLGVVSPPGESDN